MVNAVKGQEKERRVHQAVLPVSAKVDGHQECDELGGLWQIPQHIQIKERGIVPYDRIDPVEKRLLDQAVDSADHQERIEQVGPEARRQIAPDSATASCVDDDHRSKEHDESHIGRPRGRAHDQIKKILEQLAGIYHATYPSQRIAAVGSLIAGIRCPSGIRFR